MTANMKGALKDSRGRSWLQVINPTLGIMAIALAAVMQANTTMFVASIAYALSVVVVGLLSVRARTDAGYERLANLSIAFTCAHLAFLVTITGQTGSIFIWQLLLIPAWAIITGGRLAEFLWGVVTLTVLVATYLVEKQITLEPWWQPTSTHVLGSQIVLLVLSVVVVRAFWNSTETAFRRVAEREAELEIKTRSLEASRDEAVQYANARSQFLANMSHEIRTPLNGVIGMANVLRATALDEEQSNMVRTMHRSGAALLAIVNDVLDLSKLEAGKVTIEFEPMDVFECVEDTLDVFAAEAHERSIDLAYVAEDNVPDVVLGDPTRLRQVLVNLVGNAVKFTQSGFVKVALRFDAPEKLTIQVSDSGIGIPSDKLSTLFEAFQQVDLTTTRRFGGTGLGLTIVRQLTELMGGTVEVQSVPGEGSCFSFSVIAPPSGVAPASSAATQPLNASMLMLRRVAVLATEGPTRVALSEHLARVGCVVDSADSLDAIKLTKADVVCIVEWRDNKPIVPVADIRSRFANGKILILAPLADMSTRNSVRGDFDGEVHRPVRRNQLYGALERLGEPIVAFEVGADTMPQHATAHPFRILVAEDNPVNQDVITSTLKLLGYTADIAESGDQVLSAVSVRQYDVILMDVHMPGMDGLQATRALRSDKSLEAQPWIIALTANVFVQQRKACIDAGMNDFIPKPFSIEQLRTALTRAGSESQAHELPVSEPSAPNFDALEQLRKLTKAQPEHFRRLVTRHITNANAQLKQMQDLAMRADALEFERAAHTLRGASLTFGSIEVGELCALLEDRATQDDWEAVREALPHLSAVWQKAERKLRKALADNESGP